MVASRVMTVRFSILRCLIGTQASDTQIERALASLRHLYPLAHTHVHPALNDLEYEGLIASETRLVAERPERVYWITETGRRAFDRWQSEPPDDPSTDVRDPVHLRLVLATDNTENLEWLSWVIPEVAEEADRVRRIYARNRCNLTPIARLAVEELIANLERRYDFLIRALALARTRSDETAPATTSPHASARS